jgi:hypothetical protein
MYRSRFRLQKEERGVNKNKFDEPKEKCDEVEGRTNEKDHLICGDSVEQLLSGRAQCYLV